MSFHVLLRHHLYKATPHQMLEGNNIVWSLIDNKIPGRRRVRGLKASKIISGDDISKVQLCVQLISAFPSLLIDFQCRQEFPTITSSSG